MQLRSTANSSGTSCSSTKPFQPFPSRWSRAIGTLTQSYLSKTSQISYII